MKSTWKSHWLANGEFTRPNTCPKNCWKSSIAYWKTLAAIVESSHMVEVRTQGEHIITFRTTNRMDDLEVVDVNYSILKSMYITRVQELNLTRIERTHVACLIWKMCVLIEMLIYVICPWDACRLQMRPSQLMMMKLEWMQTCRSMTYTSPQRLW
jgi:hypothetical protein